MALSEHDLEKLQRDRLRWQTRRRIAITSFLSLLGFTFLMIVIDDVEKISALTGIYNVFAPVVSGIVISYYGFTTWEDKTPSK